MFILQRCLKKAQQISADAPAGASKCGSQEGAHPRGGREDRNWPCEILLPPSFPPFLFLNFNQARCFVYSSTQTGLASSNLIKMAFFFLFFLLFLTQEEGRGFGYSSLGAGRLLLIGWGQPQCVLLIGWFGRHTKEMKAKIKPDCCGPSSSRSAARPWHKPEFHQVQEMCGFLVLDGLITFDGEENVFFSIPSLCYIFFCIFRSNSASIRFLKVLATALSGDCLQRISTSLCWPLGKAANTGN